jgi:zinc/manganese transport system substrate-binding protein
MTRLLLLALAAAALLATGCGDSSDEPSAPDAARVVATTTILADLARAVGGEQADVHRLLQPSSDPHDYEPRPDDVVATAEAGVVLTSGLGLDDWMAEVVEQSGGDPRVVDVGEQVPVVREGGEAHEHEEHEEHAADEHEHEADEHEHAADEHDHGDVDPHWWHDPRNAEAAVVTIRDALTRANPSARAAYARNAAAYVRRLRALDAAVRRCVATVPPQRRKLVTDHDAFGYLADRYDLEVVGTVIPSLTTQAQPSAGDLAELARTIERERVATVFSAQSVNPRLAQAVARETDPPTRLDDSLYGDALGPDGSDGATYLAMEAHNADAIVRGLRGGRGGCPGALAVAEAGR